MKRIGFALVLSMCSFACDPEEADPSVDGGANVDSGASHCVSDLDCNDAVFCNGTERCAPDESGVDARGCVADTSACAGDCDEIHDTCVASVACVAPASPCRTDADCGASDDVCSSTATCNAASGAADARGCVFTPPSTCTYGCDPEVGCLPASPSVTVCQHDLECGGYCSGRVCDPGHASAAANGCRQLSFVPSAVCAAMGTATLCCEAAGAQTRGCYNPNLTSCASPYIDRDSDGQEAIVAGGNDCDDYDSDAFSGNLESCDALGNDEDCDPETVSRMPSDGDADGDGVPSSKCRNAGSAADAIASYTVHSTGIVRGADCDDEDPTVSPFAPDLCNGRDDDCDGTVDEFVTVPMYVDGDGDGFGDATCTFAGCGTEAGFVRNAFDCADFNPALVPGAGTCTGDATLGICANGGVVLAPCGSGQRCVTRVDGTGNCERDDR